MERSPDHIDKPKSLPYRRTQVRYIQMDRNSEYTDGPKFDSFKGTEVQWLRNSHCKQNSRDCRTSLSLLDESLAVLTLSTKLCPASQSTLGSEIDLWRSTWNSLIRGGKGAANADADIGLTSTCLLQVHCLQSTSTHKGIVEEQTRPRSDSSWYSPS